MNVLSLIDELSSFSSKNVFNPYRDVCPINDNEKSPLIRKENLKKYLENMILRRPGFGWIGRDLGYRGGKRTGLPLTDESSLKKMELLYRINGLEKSTISPEVTERTATEIWSEISKIQQLPFLWNVFPFHPHEAGNFDSNRAHTAKELSNARFIAWEVFKGFEFDVILSLGRDAEKLMNSFGYKSIYIRHPSYGGLKAFRKSISKIYSIYKLEVL
ncbi:MAG: uracil-DNA glycosylase [Pseudomonadota bacterium]|uniref:uracil-DNA glycosylase n=1 Tax=Gallaecimonas pentaromativorans TaxID=584787 RepID=UPI000A4743E6|nr:uracil-DNA glycosylase [Gallaecimonas pentaromativorans]MED5524578.1 uracil-DNA glycosylase [Pseudomonadota bacterium]